MDALHNPRQPLQPQPLQQLGGAAERAHGGRHFAGAVACKQLHLLYDARSSLGAAEVDTHEGELTPAAIDRAAKGIVRQLRCAEPATPVSIERQALNDKEDGREEARERCQVGYPIGGEEVYGRGRGRNRGPNHGAESGQAVHLIGSSR